MRPFALAILALLLGAGAAAADSCVALFWTANWTTIHRDVRGGENSPIYRICNDKPYLTLEIDLHSEQAGRMRSGLQCVDVRSSWIDVRLVGEAMSQTDTVGRYCLITR